MDHTSGESPDVWNGDRDSASFAAKPGDDGGLRVSGRWIALLALASALIGRGLTVALPGSRTGLRDWITVTRVLGALLSQLAVVACAATAVSLIGATLWRHRFGAVYRLCAAAGGAAVVTVAALSTQHRPGMTETAVIAAGAIVLSTVAAIHLLRAPTTRALGLILAATAAASLLYIASRLLALDVRAVDWTSTTWRYLTTCAFAFDVLALSLATAWIASRRVRQLLPPIGAAVVVAAFVSWGAVAGSLEGASTWQVVASRTLGEMARHTVPFVELPTRYWLETFALLLALIAAVAPRRSRVLETSLTLILVSRASVDIPLCALFLAVGALLAPFETGSS